MTIKQAYLIRTSNAPWLNIYVLIVFDKPELNILIYYILLTVFNSKIPSSMKSFSQAHRALLECGLLAQSKNTITSHIPRQYIFTQTALKAATVNELGWLLTKMQKENTEHVLRF